MTSVFRVNTDSALRERIEAYDRDSMECLLANHQGYSVYSNTLDLLDELASAEESGLTLTRPQALKSVF